MLTFENDEAGYLQWVHAHSGGFVINAPKQSGVVPDMLHKASCAHITTEKQTNYTTTDYKKICSVDRQELVDWGARHSNKFLKCKHCKP
jgi:hypothetical protein